MTNQTQNNLNKGLTLILIINRNPSKSLIQSNSNHLHHSLIPSPIHNRICSIPIQIRWTSSFLLQISPNRSRWCLITLWILNYKTKTRRIIRICLAGLISNNLLNSSSRIWIHNSNNGKNKGLNLRKIQIARMDLFLIWWTTRIQKASI